MFQKCLDFTQQHICDEMDALLTFDLYAPENVGRLVTPAKKLEDTIRLAELVIEVLQQNEEHHAEVSTTHTCTHTHTPVHTRTGTHTHVKTHRHTHTHTHTHTQILSLQHTHAHTHSITSKSICQ